MLGITKLFFCSFNFRTDWYFSGTKKKACKAAKLLAATKGFNGCSTFFTNGMIL